MHSNLNLPPMLPILGSEAKFEKNAASTSRFCTTYCGYFRAPSISGFATVDTPCALKYLGVLYCGYCKYWSVDSYCEYSQYQNTPNMPTILFWATLGCTVVAAPRGEHLPVMMDANSRTDARGKSCVDDKVLGAYARDTLNDNGRHLLAFPAENQLAPVNTF